MIKKIIQFILIKISRIIYYLVPIELRPRELRPRKGPGGELELKLNNDLAEETFNHFKEHIKESIVFVRKHKGFAIALGAIFTPLFHYLHNYSTIYLKEKIVIMQILQHMYKNSKQLVYIEYLHYY